MSAPDEMNIRELAAYLRLPSETLYKYVRSGRLPARKSGREWVFDREAIDARIADNTHMPMKGGAPTVLVVDDEPVVRRVFVLWLEGAGYKVEEASNGEQAMEKLQAGTIQLVFLDLMMPRLDGVETLRRIRTLPDVPDVVIVTGYYNGALMEDVLAMGPVHVLKKPVQRQQFLQAATTYLPIAGVEAARTVSAPNAV
jgi:excisionase family DNA binding protein